MIKSIRISCVKDFGCFNEYTAPLGIWKVSQSQTFDIIHMHTRMDSILFWKRSKVKYIFESHGFHPGISFRYAWLFTESWGKRLILILCYPLFQVCFWYNIRRMDRYYVSIPGIAAYLKGNYDARWLPNPVDTELFQRRSSCLRLDPHKVNIFYPTGFRKIKNSEFALALMLQLQEKYPTICFYLIKTHTQHLKPYLPALRKLEKNIVWIEKVPREEMASYYSAEWDCVLGSFFPEKWYAILNMIELEAMACKAPVLGHDLYEVLFEPLENMFALACKLIEDTRFKAEYIQRNYNYVLATHSLAVVAKHYEADLKSLYTSP
ncbi:MAG: glycosyltransferase family 4 protein [bacterium]|nr:glycosyltransferase family 4 protein [bacterium]